MSYSQSHPSTNKVLAVFWLFGPPKKIGAQWVYLGSISVRQNDDYNDIPIGAIVVYKGISYRVTAILEKKHNKYNIPITSIVVKPCEYDKIKSSYSR